MEHKTHGFMYSGWENLCGRTYEGKLGQVDPLSIGSADYSIVTTTAAVQARH